MARIEVQVDRAPLSREQAALWGRMQASVRIRDQVAELTRLGVAQTELVILPARRRGQRQVLVQLSDPYWQILEQEAV
jgi:hypothetical protein